MYNFLNLQFHLQSLPVKEQSSKSQSAEYPNVLLQKQLNDGLEIVKLLQVTDTNSSILSRH